MTTDLDARMAALLDGADHDWTVSGDAMRWMPDGPAGEALVTTSKWAGWTPIGHVDADALDWTPPPDPARTAQAYAGLDTTTPRRITIGLDMSAAVRAFRGLAETIREFDRLMSSPAGAGIKQALAALEDSQQRAQRRVHVAYRARQIARRRRNRG